MPVDELLPLKNSFYTGAYQKVIQGYSALSGSQQSLAKPYYLRSLLATKNYQKAAQEVTQRDFPENVAIQLLAKYFAQRNESYVEQMKGLVESNDPDDAQLHVIAASLFILHGLLEEGLVLLHKHPKNLECVALTIQTFLQMDRVDLARKELAQLKQWADDATLAQLIEAWVSLSIGGKDKCQEANYVFEELGANKGSSKMLNGNAICLMHSKRLSDAEAVLNEALALDSTDADIIANLIICSNALGKFEQAQKYLGMLRQVQASHPLMQDLASKHSLFDKAASRYN